MQVNIYANLDPHCIRRASPRGNVHNEGTIGNVYGPNMADPGSLTLIYACDEFITICNLQLMSIFNLRVRNSNNILPNYQSPI